MPEAISPFIDFAGRRILVTGASAGIGRAIAVEIGRRGGQLILMGRDQARLAETASMLPLKRAEMISLDLRDAGPIAAAVKTIVSKCGRIYGLCHCAGMVETLPLNAMSQAGLLTLFNVNVMAGLELAKAVSRRDSITEEGGSILFVSSIYASVGMAGQIGYSASKGALNAAARAMSVELARRNIRVNTISPGLVHTKLADQALQKLDPEKTKKLEEAHPLGVGTPEDVARAAAFLLAPESRWITGTDLILDGGYTAQ
jgi:NAD(P)-dependent dehydrogenase (short-subunit alcohol dehydrogenase family)